MADGNKNDNSNPSDNESQAARVAFDRHGHGFHFAVLKALRTIPSKWRFEAAEFPVDLNGTNLHIDIVLRHPRAVMAVECKRVDPALGAWCFARSSFVSANEVRSHLVSLQRIDIPGGDLAHHRLVAVSNSHDSVHTDHQYHVCLPLKTGQRGDGAGTGRSAMDDAITQAVRGANGLVQAYAAHPKPAEVMQAGSLRVLPVVITTARLLALTTDLADADLASGRLPDSANVVERPWVWFSVMTSSKIRHSVTRVSSVSDGPPQSLGALADRDYAISVGIVSADGIADFLRATRVHVGEFA